MWGCTEYGGWLGWPLHCAKQAIEEWESANSLACAVHVSVIAHFEMNRLGTDEEEKWSEGD